MMKDKITKTELMRMIREEVDKLKEINPYHRDGKFSSKKDADCVSTYFVDKKRSSVKGNLRDKHIAGRGRSKSGRGEIYCRDGKKMNEVDVLLDEVSKLKKDFNPDKLREKCYGIGLRTIEDLIRMIAHLEKARLGKA